MTDTDASRPGFDRELRGYDRVQVDTYIEHLESQLRTAQQRAKPHEAGGPASAVRALRPVPSGQDATEAATPPPVQFAEAEARRAAAEREATLDDLTSERDRLMAAIGDLERRRAAVLGAAMAESRA